MPAAVKGLLPDDVPASSILKQRQPTLDEVHAACRDHYQIPADQFFVRTDKQATIARGFLVYLARRWCRTSYDDLCALFGKRAHSTVSNYENKIAGRLTADELLRDDLDIIERRIAEKVLGRPHAY